MPKIIRVKVIPNARISGVIQEKYFLKVKVHAPAEKGKANKEVIAMIAEYFTIPKSAVILLEGETASHKVFRIDD